MRTTSEFCRSVGLIIALYFIKGNHDICNFYFPVLWRPIACVASSSIELTMAVKAQSVVYSIVYITGVALAVETY